LADFHLQAGSPAIDKAYAAIAPAIDYDGILRPQGAGYDIGAYEHADSSTTSPLLGDINGDGMVNILDYTLLSNAFGTTNPASDLNSDGTVNILDYTILSNNFGKSN
jgi:hypothetical protein